MDDEEKDEYEDIPIEIRHLSSDERIDLDSDLETCSIVELGNIANQYNVDFKYIKSRCIELGAFPDWELDDYEEVAQKIEHLDIVEIHNLDFDLETADILDLENIANQYNVDFEYIGWRCEQLNLFNEWDLEEYEYIEKEIRHLTTKDRIEFENELNFCSLDDLEDFAEQYDVDFEFVKDQCVNLGLFTEEEIYEYENPDEEIKHLYSHERKELKDELMDASPYWIESIAEEYNVSEEYVKEKCIEFGAFTKEELDDFEQSDMELQHLDADERANFQLDIINAQVEDIENIADNYNLETEYVEEKCIENGNITAEDIREYYELSHLDADERANFQLDIMNAQVEDIENIADNYNLETEYVEEKCIEHGNITAEDIREYYDKIYSLNGIEEDDEYYETEEYIDNEYEEAIGHLSEENKEILEFALEYFSNVDYDELADIFKVDKELLINHSIEQGYYRIDSSNDSISNAKMAKREEIIFNLERIIEYSRDYLFETRENHYAYEIKLGITEADLIGIYKKLIGGKDRNVNIAYNYLVRERFYLCDHQFGLNLSHMMMLGIVFAGEKINNAAEFVVKNWNKKNAARYLVPGIGFLYEQAIEDNLHIECVWDREYHFNESCIDMIIYNLAENDFDEAMNAWLWILENFWPCREHAYYSYNECFTDEVLKALKKNFSSDLKKYFKADSKLKDTLYELIENKDTLNLLKSFEENEVTDIKANTFKEIAEMPVYVYCGVIFAPNSKNVYYYLSKNDLVKVGDIVKVKVKNQIKETLVVSVGKYNELSAPFPPDKAKFIED